jgi:hypothetical protein
MEQNKSVGMICHDLVESYKDEEQNSKTIRLSFRSLEMRLFCTFHIKKHLTFTYYCRNDQTIHLLVSCIGFSNRHPGSSKILPQSNPRPRSPLSHLSEPHIRGPLRTGLPYHSLRHHFPRGKCPISTAFQPQLRRAEMPSYRCCCMYQLSRNVGERDV